MQRRNLLASILWAPLLPAAGRSSRFPNIPAEYLREAEQIPDFWVSTVQAVNRFLDEHIRTGKVASIGNTAGKRQVRAVFYGRPRQGNGTTTFSGSLGFGNVRSYIGPDCERKVYMAMASVHGGEFEGIVGMVNLLSVLETGKDLRGEPWPEIAAAAKALDRLILIPVTNVDGRARVPLRMGRHRGSDETIPEYFNTGGRPDGQNIGWPACKQFIPLDFSRTQFPGGYPNDAGVNIQHDDFLGRRQPETQALLDLTSRERPDLILNMHTGAVFPLLYRSFVEPMLAPVFDELFRRTHTRLALEGLQETGDPGKEANPARVKPPFSFPYNLDTALNLHCGALVATYEVPFHSATTGKRDGKPIIFSPTDLLRSELFCHQEAMRFLAEKGGRNRWGPVRRS
jgi:hypothetical protein